MVNSWMEDQEQQFFCTLEKHWNKCITVTGDYIDKKGLLRQTVARDSAPWWIVIQYRQLAENGAFFIPLSYSAPPLPIFPLEFRSEVMRQETRVMGLLCGEGCVILTVTVFDWSTRVTDSGTDGQRDGRWHIARYSIYAVAR